MEEGQVEQSGNDEGVVRGTGHGTSAFRGSLFMSVCLPD